MQKKTVFVEKNKLNVRLIKNNISLLGVEEQTQVISAPVEAITGRLTSMPADIIFLDPPYELIKPEYIRSVFTSIIDNKLLVNDGVLILEHPGDREVIECTIAGLNLTKQKKYGKSALSFWGK